MSDIPQLFVILMLISLQFVRRVLYVPSVGALNKSHCFLELSQQLKARMEALWKGREGLLRSREGPLSSKDKVNL